MTFFNNLKLSEEGKQAIIHRWLKSSTQALILEVLCHVLNGLPTRERLLKYLKDNLKKDEANG